MVVGEFATRVNRQLRDSGTIALRSGGRSHEVASVFGIVFVVFF